MSISTENKLNVLKSGIAKQKNTCLNQGLIAEKYNDNLMSVKLQGYYDALCDIENFINGIEEE